MSIMNTTTTVKARDQFAELVNRAAYGKERIILSRRGRNIAAFVPLEDIELLEVLEDCIDVQDAKLALEEVREKGSVSLTAFKEKLKRRR